MTFTRVPPRFSSRLHSPPGTKARMDLLGYTRWTPLAPSSHAIVIDRKEIIGVEMLGGQI